MNIQTIESIVRNIVAQALEMEPADVNNETRIADWLINANINNDVCLYLNINIKATEAAQCRTVGQYVELVKNRLENN